MAIFNVNDFKSEILYNGLARSNRFEINMFMPKELAGLVEFTSQRTVSLFCHISSLPPKNIGVAQERIYGPNYQIPLSVDYGGDAITMTFYVDRSMKVKKFFDAWTNYIIDDRTYHVRYQKSDAPGNLINSYVVPIELHQLDERDQPTYSIRLIDAFPRSIGLMELNAAALNTPHQLNVTFAYRKWETIKETRKTGSAT